MPLARVVSSASPVDPSTAHRLLADLSKLLAKELAKPEAYVMTCLEAPATMTFGGSDAPAAYVEIKNVGRFTSERTRALSAALCPLVGAALGIEPDRIYIEFTNAEGDLWGHGGDTFGD
jgi:phenylpyruvate tautomerase